MISVLQESTPKARKDHRCALCDGTISAGTAYFQQRNVSPDHGFYYWRSHIVCRQVLASFSERWWAEEQWNPDPSDFRAEYLAPAGYRVPISRGEPVKIGDA